MPRWPKRKTNLLTKWYDEEDNTTDNEDDKKADVSENNQHANAKETVVSNHLLQNTSTASAPCWDPEQNHGRYCANDYPGCDTVDIALDDELLKSGKCPHCAECNNDANVYRENPKVVLLLDSLPLISGTRYQLDKVRCSVCQTYFTAPLPPALKNRSKFSNRCVTNIAIYHYYAGLPFKRLETLQATQGIQLPDSTQYDCMNKLYQSVIKPVVDVLKQYAANGTSLFFDDTPEAHP